MSISPVARFEFKLANASASQPLVLTTRSAAAIWRDAMEKGRVDIIARLAEVTGLNLLRQTPTSSGWATGVTDVVAGENQDPNFADPQRAVGAAQGAGDQAGSLKVYNLGLGGQATWTLGKPSNEVVVYGNDWPGREERAAVYGITKSGEEIYLGIAGDNPTYINRFNGLKPHTDRAGGHNFLVPDGKLVVAVKVVDLRGGGNGYDVDAVHGRVKR